MVDDDATAEREPASFPVVIVLGPPASGKTTLGRRIARELCLPFYSRDDFKEHLFDCLGWSDRAWSKKIGRASWDLFWHVIITQLAARQPTIIETNFKHPRDTERFRELATHCPFRPIQINCVVDGEVLFERHRTRSLSSERHPGHVDHLETVQSELADELLRGRTEPLDIGGSIIEVDTTVFADIDVAALLITVRRLVEGG